MTGSVGEHYGGAPLFDNALHFGRLGVDFFFVLSGFLILHAHRRDIGRPDRFARYVSRRVTRLYPFYWLALAGALVVLAAGGNFPRLTVPDWITTLSLVRFTGVHAPIGPAWTLFHEILFYAIFSVCLLSRRVGIALLGLWGAAVLATFHYSPCWGEFGFLPTLLSAYNLHFFIGMTVCLLANRVPDRAALPMLVTGVLTVAALAIVEATLGEMLPLRIIYGTAFGLALAGMVAIDRTEGRSWPALPRLLGDASYSIYLVHLPASAVILKLLDVAGLLGKHPAWLVYALVLLATLVAGCAAHIVIERPLLDGVRRFRVDLSRAAPKAA